MLRLNGKVNGCSSKRLFNTALIACLINFLSCAGGTYSTLAEYCLEAFLALLNPEFTRPKIYKKLIVNGFVQLLREIVDICDSFKIISLSAFASTSAVNSTVFGEASNDQNELRFSYTSDFNFQRYGNISSADRGSSTYDTTGRGAATEQSMPSLEKIGPIQFVYNLIDQAIQKTLSTSRPIMQDQTKISHPADTCEDAELLPSSKLCNSKEPNSQIGDSEKTKIQSVAISAEIKSTGSSEVTNTSLMTSTVRLMRLKCRHGVNCVPVFSNSSPRTYTRFLPDGALVAVEIVTAGMDGRSEGEIGAGTTRTRARARTVPASRSRSNSSSSKSRLSAGKPRQRGWHNTWQGHMANSKTDKLYTTYQTGYLTKGDFNRITTQTKERSPSQRSKSPKSRFGPAIRKWAHRSEYGWILLERPPSPGTGI